jgi:hypothetical protein
MENGWETALLPANPAGWMRATSNSWWPQTGHSDGKGHAMTQKLNHWVKSRLTEPEYAALAARAGIAGITVSAYLREIVTVERTQFDSRESLIAIEERMRRDLGAANVVVEPLLVEAVLLSREVLANRDPQALSRVRLQLDARYPGRMQP